MKAVPTSQRGGCSGREAELSWFHELLLNKAADGYQHFDARDDGWTKVVLHPDGSSG
ncbi:hypothetical protein ACFYPZ_16360 [Streptomyces sp. NPDC005506]|uniref:hypothetical protein n=1 Tax=unclassified Streptomyces TaxID=2593676 RepID=UPI0036C64E79